LVLTVQRWMSLLAFRDVPRQPGICLGSFYVSPVAVMACAVRSFWGVLRCFAEVLQLLGFVPSAYHCSSLLRSTKQTDGSLQQKKYVDAGVC
jgi:hypothetical protein